MKVLFDKTKFQDSLITHSIRVAHHFAPLKPLASNSDTRSIQASFLAWRLVIVMTLPPCHLFRGRV